MMTLDEIAIKHGTDKATEHPVNGHGYMPYYEYYLHQWRNAEIKLLEIGVGGGESIRTWLDYFTQAKIYGIDVVAHTNNFNIPNDNWHVRYQFSHGNQTDRTMWKCFVANHGSDWDVIIDDGGHYNDEVIISFEEMWPHVKSGGLYCVEDIGVATAPGTIFVRDGFPNHFDWIKGRMADMVRGSDIEAIHYVKELVVFRKK